MVSNLTKSKEAMSALGSAVAEQVLEAMKMQGRQAGQPSTSAFYGSHPAPAPGAMLPPHVAAPPPPVGAHAHNPGMGCMGFPFGIPYTDWSSAWPGHTRAPVSFFTRLGPPNLLFLIKNSHWETVVPPLTSLLKENKVVSILHQRMRTWTLYLCTQTQIGTWR